MHIPNHNPKVRIHPNICGGKFSWMQCQKKNCKLLVFWWKAWLIREWWLWQMAWKTAVSLIAQSASLLLSPLMAQLLALMHFKHTADTLDGKCTSFPRLSLLSLLSYTARAFPHNTLQTHLIKQAWASSQLFTFKLTATSTVTYADKHS